MKCPLCSNDGSIHAIVAYTVGSIYFRNWYDKEREVESELEEYDEGKVILHECGKCLFVGPEGMFEEEVSFPEVEEDEKGFYLDGFEARVGPCDIQGKLYIPSAMVNRCRKVVQIHQAVTIADLPGGLCEGDDLLRQLAVTKFKELGGNTQCQN